MGTMNPNVKTMEYAVRGPLMIRAVNIEKELAQVSLRGLLREWGALTNNLALFRAQNSRLNPS